MWPHSCEIITKYTAYYTCLSPTTCMPVFSLSCPFSPSEERRHMMGTVSRGHSAVTLTVRHQPSKLHSSTHTRRYSSHLSEITTPLLKQILLLPGRLGRLQRVLASPCVCVQSCMYASTLWDYTNTS